MTKLTLKVIVFCFFSLVLILGFSSNALAVEQVAVAGYAEVVNTGSHLDFSGSNSNVTISNSTKNFSGFAWSDDLGWIDFSTVSVNSVTRIVSGKATVQNTGGYLDFNASPYNSNVILPIDGNFSGLAWSDDLGWIDFSGVSALGVIGELPETGGIGAMLSNLALFNQNHTLLFLIILIASATTITLVSFLMYKRKKV